MTAPTPNSMPGAQQPPAAPAPADGQQPPAGGTPPAAPTPPATPAQPQAPVPPAPTPDAPKPPWEASGEQFDPERAWNLIQNLRTELGEYKSQTQPIVEEHERLRRASQTELETAREDLGNVTSERDAWRNEAIRAKAEALAADKFVDADTALTLVGDLSGFVDGKTIDTNKLQQRLDQLATDKPFLVKQAPPQGFTPNRGQGQSATGPVTPAQIAQHAESQQDWKAAGAAKAQQLLTLRSQQA